MRVYYCVAYRYPGVTWIEEAFPSREEAERFSTLMGFLNRETRLFERHVPAREMVN